MYSGVKAALLLMITAVKVPRGMAIRRHKNASNVRFLDWLLLTKV